MSKVKITRIQNILTAGCFQGFFSGSESNELDVSNFLLYEKKIEPKSSVELVYGIMTSVMSFFHSQLTSKIQREDVLLTKVIIN